MNFDSQRHISSPTGARLNLYTALPELRSQLGTTEPQALWIINAYPLVLAGLLLGTGTLGDRIGHAESVIGDDHLDRARKRRAKRLDPGADQGDVGAAVDAHLLEVDIEAVLIPVQRDPLV